MSTHPLGDENPGWNVVNKTEIRAMPFLYEERLGPFIDRLGEGVRKG